MSKKVKLVFVTQNIAPFRLQWLEALAEYLDIIVYHLDDYDGSVNTKYLEVSPNNIKIKAEYVNIFGHRFFEYSKILHEQADMILLDGYGFIGQVALIACLRVHKVDFFMTIDGGLLPSKESLVKYIIKKFCLNSPKGILSTSEITDRFIKHYKTSSAPLVRHYFSSIYLRDIHNPSNAEKLTLKRKLNLENRFSVLSVGRFIPIKGFDILLKAAALVNSDLYFVFVGGIPPKEYLDIAENSPVNNVRFVEFMPKENLAEYYLACDVFTVPSRGDVWGLVVGEAMAYGLPVISSNKCIAGVSMIQNYINGFIIEDELPTSYISKINELKHNNQLTAEIAHNNCELMKKYAIDISIKNDISCFEHITGLIIKEGNSCKP